MVASFPAHCTEAVRLIQLSECISERAFYLPTLLTVSYKYIFKIRHRLDSRQLAGTITATAHLQDRQQAAVFHATQQQQALHGHEHVQAMQEASFKVFFISCNPRF